MPRYKAEDLDIATVLYAVHNMQQMEIAALLQWSPSKVSRVLQAARDSERWGETRSYWVEEKHLQRPVNEIEQDIERHQGTQWVELKKWLQAMSPQETLREVHVFRSERGESDDRSHDWDQSVMRFARAAAVPVQRRLAHARRCGISWGRTLRAIVWKIRDAQLPAVWSSRPIQFFPLWGQVPEVSEAPSQVFTRDAELDSTQLAEDLSVLANNARKQITVPSLRMAFAIMPKKFAADTSKRETMRDLMRCDSHYREVFDRLAPGMDAALVSMGSFDHSGRALSDSVMNYAGLNRDELSELCVGDIGGVLLPQQDLDKKQQRRLKRLQDLWLGVGEAELKACASNAARDRSRAGVLTCAVGRERANALSCAITRGLCTELFIDHDLRWRWSIGGRARSNSIIRGQYRDLWRPAFI